MSLSNVILNEFVHVDNVLRIGDYYNIVYEPTDFTFNKVHGTIYFDGGLRWVGFRQSENSERLLVDCDEVLAGRVEGQTIHMIWLGSPGEHYLCVSYETARGCDPFKPNWRKEGF